MARSGASGRPRSSSASSRSTAPTTVASSSPTWRIPPSSRSFPLLLVLVTVLGLVAAGDPGFRQDAVNAVASQVPLIGNELAGNVHQLQRSSLIGLIVGLVTLLWGTTGLAQAGLFTMEQV